MPTYHRVSRNSAKRGPNIGSTIDHESKNLTAAKRVIAFQIAKEMKRSRLSKSEMAHRMKTSRPALDRLLDPKNRSVTLSTLERAASAVGKKLKVELD